MSAPGSGHDLPRKHKSRSSAASIRHLMKTPRFVTSESTNLIATLGHWRRAACASALLLVASIAPFANTAHAASYVFTNIADSSGIFSPTAQTRGIGSGFLSINKSGLDDGVRGVFEGNGGPITSIALSSGPMFAGTAGASINDAGTVVFSASLDAGGSGIFTGNGGPPSTVALSGGGVTGFGGAPEINDAGRVLYGASLGGGNGGILLRGGGQPDATVALTSGPMFNAIVGATINSQGVVAFSAVLDSGSEGVFPGSGGPITTTGLEPFPDEWARRLMTLAR